MSDSKCPQYTFIKKRTLSHSFNGAKKLIFYASHISPLPATFILSNNLCPGHCFTISLLFPQITVIQPRDPICESLNITCTCLPLASISAFSSAQNDFQIPSFLASLSGLYKCCSFFKTQQKWYFPSEVLSHHKQELITPSLGLPSIVFVCNF